MTDVTSAFAAIRSRLDAGAGIPLRYQAEDVGPLPATPTVFAWAELLVERSQIVAFGGGVGANTHRNYCTLLVYVFIPKGQGMATSLPTAETIAALFRSYRTADISCFESIVRPSGDGSQLAPPGERSLVNNYWYALVEVSLFFDQVA